jgi:hypothetical protein
MVSRRFSAVLKMVRRQGQWVRAASRFASNTGVVKEIGEQGKEDERSRKSMASKWLEERLERLLPMLASLGQEQEEHIKHLCEEELQAWRQRPSLKEANSLSKPLTEARNRLRETLQITDTNCWINPKSGAREHLSLKYLNFSSQEWIKMNIPSECVRLALQRGAIVADEVLA